MFTFRLLLFFYLSLQITDWEKLKSLSKRKSVEKQMNRIDKVLALFMLRVFKELFPFSLALTRTHKIAITPRSAEFNEKTFAALNHVEWQWMEFWPWPWLFTSRVRFPLCHSLAFVLASNPSIHTSAPFYVHSSNETSILVLLLMFCVLWKWIAWKRAIISIFLQNWHQLHRPYPRIDAFNFSKGRKRASTFDR